ncbi:SWIB domain-containing protein [Pseudomonas sp. IT-P258]|nr:hypothetical protein ASD91_10885 [Pseudomonas sp. Root68]KRB65828.1 hypothetical protein ASD95_10190 [Pseudomonas sp. Root71]
MVENPGMWVEARSLFKVGTVGGLLRALLMDGPEAAKCGVSTGAGEAWVSASIIERWLTIEQVA